jgi:hypothetical protein
MGNGLDGFIAAECQGQREPWRALPGFPPATPWSLGALGVVHGDCSAPLGLLIVEREVVCQPSYPGMGMAALGSLA